MKLAYFLFAALVAVAHGYNAFRQLLEQSLQTVHDYSRQFLNDNNFTYAPSPDYPYWNFLPQYTASLLPSGQTVEFKTTCYGKNIASLTVDGNELRVRIESSEPLIKDGGPCNDIYTAITTNTFNFNIPVTPPSASTDDVVITEAILTIPSDETDAERWDLDNKGVRLMKYHPSVTAVPGTTFSNLIKTVELFVPELTMSVGEPFAKMNAEFLSKYSHFDKKPRNERLNRPPAAEEVHSGDAFYVMRLDGLNTMLAWAMGSTTGHVTTAMWIDGELYICESTIDGAYWPTDYIQKTPYQTWLDQAQAASYQVVWAPLNDAARKNYDETAAVEWFKSQEGFNYGFQTMIWAWLDTAKENFPCLPPDFSSNCLQWELLEPVLALVDRAVPEIGDMIWNPGYIKRINGTQGERTVEMYREAADLGMQSVDVISIPEQDTWLYNTTRYDEPALGRAMVCCVFVCSTWKAAGVFGDLADSINCAEQTNWDDYVLTIHADAYRQVVGEWSLELNDFHTKDLYAHIAETCPSLPPDYAKPADC